MNPKAINGRILSAIAAAAIIALFSGCGKEEAKPVVSNEPVLDLLKYEDASQFVLEKLKIDGALQVEVRLLRKMIGNGDVVASPRSSNRRVSSDFEWFGVVDKVPGAFFPHPVDYVYLDYKKQEVRVTPQSELPELNGEAVWKDAKAYFDSDDLIYSSIRLPESGGAMALGGSEGAVIGAPEINYSKPRYMAPRSNDFSKRHFALLMYNFADGPMGDDVRENLTLMKEALTLNGYTVLEFKHGSEPGEREPFVHLGDENGYSLFQVRNFVQTHSDANDVNEEVFIYYTGYASAEGSGLNAKIYIDILHNYGGEKGGRAPARKLYASDLADLFKGLSTRHLNVVLDTNHGGGFMKDLLALPNVESVAVSCKAGEYAYSGVYDAGKSGALADPYGKDKGERGSEFTSGFAKTLMDHSMARPEGTEATPASALVELGFKGAVGLDVAALSGATHPCAEIRAR